MDGLQVIVIEDVSIAIAPIVSVEGSRRQAERETVRGIMDVMFGPEVELLHHDSGAPYIEGAPHISITHCKDSAALAICREHPVGIDAEQWRTALRRIACKFLSDTEIKLFKSDIQLLKAWTIKEAVYKVAGGDALDFRHNIAISPDMTSATALGRTYRLHTFPAGEATVTLAIPMIQ